MQADEADLAARDLTIKGALAAYRRAYEQEGKAGTERAALAKDMKRVLALAASREESSSAGPVAANARFFVRTALLTERADHYTRLGCRRTDPVATIRDHYRLLMRLTHPDFSASTDARWPTGAAARLNGAYEVLSTPQSREAYDAQLQESPKPLIAPRRPTTARMHMPPEAARLPRPTLQVLAWGFGALSAVAVAALFAATESDSDGLIERVRTTSTVATAPTLIAPDAGAVNPIPVATESPANRPQQHALKLTHVIEISPASRPLPTPVAQPLPAPQPSPVSASENAPASRTSGPTSTTVAALTTQSQAADQPAPQVPDANVPTMAEVHPVLARLLQELEARRADRIELLVEAESRAAPSTRGFISNYETLTTGAQRVRVVQAQFSSRPQGTKLVVLGNLALEVGGTTASSNPHMALEAQFSRGPNGVALTRLSTGR